LGFSAEHVKVPSVSDYQGKKVYGGPEAQTGEPRRPLLVSQVADERQRTAGPLFPFYSAKEFVMATDSKIEWIQRTGVSFFFMQYSGRNVKAEEMRVLVTGGRDFSDRTLLFEALDRLHSLHGFTVLIHGDASGADRLAGEWATERGVEVLACPADWKTHGRAAGPIRNKEMLNEKPQLVVAFPGGKGTADMVAKARKAGVKVVDLQRGEG